MDEMKRGGRDEHAVALLATVGGGCAGEAR